MFEPFDVIADDEEPYAMTNKIVVKIFFSLVVVVL